MGLYAARDGTLYVVDRGNHRVMRYAPNSGRNGTQIGDGRGNGPRQLDGPTAVVVDEVINAVYISDYENKRVQLWHDRGMSARVETVLGQLTTNNSGTSSFSQANDIQLDPRSNDTLYISDTPKRRVWRWKLHSKDGDSSFLVSQAPSGIHVDAQQNVYVADCYAHEISKWFDGDRVAETSQGVSLLNRLNCPSAVVVDRNGNMFIADSQNHRIVLWEVNATRGICIVGCSTIRGNRTDQLDTPTDVTFDWKGNLLVADTANNRVQRFDLLINTSCSTYRLILTHPQL